MFLQVEPWTTRHRSVKNPPRCHGFTEFELSSTPRGFETAMSFKVQVKHANTFVERRIKQFTRFTFVEKCTSGDAIYQPRRPRPVCVL